MNFLIWVLSICLGVFLLFEGVVFHRSTVCRQEAWLKSTELKTRALLTASLPKDFTYHSTCKLKVLRSEDQVSWISERKIHRFDLRLQGEL